MNIDQRRAAAAAVRQAMRAKGWEAPQLAARAGVNVATVRDFLAARRWPRNGKRAAIERELKWPNGRIAEIAAAAEPEGDPVRVALDNSELTPEHRYEVYVHYRELLDAQQRAG